MKISIPLLVFIIFVGSTKTVRGQYYKASRKNKALFITNAYSSDNVPLLTNSVEFGSQFGRLLWHGGATLSNPLLKNSENDVVQKNIKYPIYAGLVGADINLINVPILNLSHKSYCKYFVGSLNIGFDTFKNLQTSVTNDYGYRAKAYLAFSILRTGSNKRDIGYRRYLQFGYCYTDNNIGSKKNIAYHSFMLNLLIVKRRLIKFADWF